MNIMDYVFLEIACILLKCNELSKVCTPEEVDKINETIATAEKDLLNFCSLENFLEAKKCYEQDIANGEKMGLLGVSLIESLTYTNELIAKKERGR